MNEVLIVLITELLLIIVWDIKHKYLIKYIKQYKKQ